MDTDWDRKMKLFKAKYKLEGIGLITELFKTIYSEGYYYPWDEESKILFADEHNIEEDRLSEMVDFAIEKGIFDNGIYSKYRILTSSGIQKRYLNSCLKRNQVAFCKEYLLIEPQIPDWSKTEISMVSFKEVSDTGNSEKESLNPVIDSGSTQSKGKKIKVYKNKEYVHLAEFLAEKIEENDPKHFHNKNKIKKITSWANDIRLLIEQDDRSIEEVKKVITWCQEDYFWKSNILSGAKLRKQFPALLLQMNRGKPRASPPPRPPKICPICQRQIIGTQASCSGCGLPVKDFGNSRVIEAYRKQNGIT